MNKISKKTEYGLMALKYLNDLSASNNAIKSDAYVSAKDLSAETHAPFDVIARVLQALSSRGILKAEYGVEGGYQLIKDLKTISVFDLITILESSTDLTKCLGSENECELSSNCNIISPITSLNNKVQNFYKSISLDEVLRV